MKRLTEQLESGSVQPDITPLIDVIFMLLLFFIVTTTFAEDTFFPVRLPRVANADKAEIIGVSDVAMVEISRDGEFAVNRAFVPSFDKLYETLDALKKEGRCRAVIIKADEESGAGRLVELLDILRGLEINDFSVYTREDST